MGWRRFDYPDWYDYQFLLLNLVRKGFGKYSVCMTHNRPMINHIHRCSLCAACTHYYRTPSPIVVLAYDPPSQVVDFGSYIHS